MSPTLRAACWMLGAIFSFTAMALAGRELGTRFDTFEIMMYRSALGFVIVLTLSRATGTLREVGFDRWKLHLARNVFHFTGQNLWFYAVTMIPLAQLFALEFTAPLWVILLSPLLLGERLTGLRALSALIGFTGILIVTQPGSMVLSEGLIAAASCAIFFALTYVYTKKLTRTESITAIMFFLTAFQLVFGLVTAGYDGDILLPQATDLPLLGVVAVCGLLAHFSIVKALGLAPAAVVAPIDFARLPIIAIVGMLLYAEPLDPFVLIGAVLIFGANYLNIWAEGRRRIA
ncbi:MAG: DMT family transporter [Sulfitobacter sp.]|nr:DMT family transporter [Sulfitobacter sp.]